RRGIEMLLKHLGVIHFVDVISAENEDVLRAFAANRVDVLVDGVGCAAIPLFADAHLRRKDFYKFTQSHDRGPPGTNVTAEAERFVLCKNKNTAEPGIDATRKGNVNDAIRGAKRNSRFGAIASKRPETFALATGEKDDDGITHVRHREASGME